MLNAFEYLVQFQLFDVAETLILRSSQVPLEGATLNDQVARMEPVVDFPVAVGAEEHALFKFTFNTTYIGYIGNTEIFDAWIYMMGFESRQTLVVATDLAFTT